MTNSEFETKETRCVRGLEAKTRTSWEKSGWEFVSQEQGKLQSKLVFRRPKPKTPWLLIGGGAAFVVVIIVGSIIMGAIQGNNSPKETAQPAKTQNSASASASSTTATPPTSPQLLTVENNADLKALLASNGNDYAMNAAFYEKYKGQTLDFDSNISYVSNHGDYKTRYDVLIYAGDYSETKTIGPAFRVIDKNVSDFGFTGPNAPSSLKAGTNVRIKATLYDWNEQQGSFVLKPVQTTLR